MRGKKRIFILLCAGALWLGSGSAAMASEYEDTPTVPAGTGLVPRTLTLLEGTPYYVIPNALKNKAEGDLEPQTVEVLEAETGWAWNDAWWKIKTPDGSRWVKTRPAGIAAPAPETVTLLEETPIYPAPDESSGPSARLSPQDVRVVDAGSRWFCSEPVCPGEDRMKWVKIETSWLGDQWIHLPYYALGRVEPMGPETQFYSYTELFGLPYAYDGINRQVRREGPVFLKTDAVFEGPAGKLYRVEDEDDHVRLWTWSVGQKVTPAAEKLTRKAPISLYKLPMTRFDEEPSAVLEPQTVEVFEKIAPAYYLDDWFHVRAGEAEGWFSPLYSQPEDPVPEKVALDLGAEVTELFRYPGGQATLNYGRLGPQTVHPDASWTGKEGTRWYRIPTYLGPAWIALDGQKDRVLIPGRENGLEVHAEERTGFYYPLEEGGYSFSGVRLAELEDGGLVFHSANLARTYGPYQAEAQDGGWWSFSDGSGYAFRVKAGERTAATFWNGTPSGTVQLKEAPREPALPMAGPGLVLEDMERLFGYTVESPPDRGWIILHRTDYRVTEPGASVGAAGGEWKLPALLYDRRAFAEGESELRPSLTLQSGDGNATEAVAKSKLLYSLDSYSGLFDLTAALRLSPGKHTVTAVLRAGEKIHWQRSFQVEVP
ncbi:hypothetical protein [Gorillibacterium sp. sgz5001074]|uniref:hypothetical protein n=1 Tax=Gorillibacterium sp. sgz5001074 TaxID=3446695 RepID=UPI003F679EFA